MSQVRDLGPPEHKYATLKESFENAEALGYISVDLGSDEFLKKLGKKYSSTVISLLWEHTARLLKSNEQERSLVGNVMFDGGVQFVQNIFDHTGTISGGKTVIVHLATFNPNADSGHKNNQANRIQAIVSEAAIHFLTEQVDTLGEVIREKEADSLIEDKNQEIMDLQGQIMHLESEQATFKKKVQAQGEQALATFKEMVEQRYKGHMDKLTKKLLQQDKQLQAATTKADDLENQLSVATTKTDDLEKQLSAATNQLSVATTKTDDLEKQLSAATNQLSVATTKTDDLEKQLSAATNQLSVATTKANDLEKQLSAATTKADALKEQVRDLKIDKKLLDNQQADKGQAKKSILESYVGNALETTTITELTKTVEEGDRKEVTKIKNAPVPPTPNPTNRRNHSSSVGSGFLALQYTEQAPSTPFGSGHQYQYPVQQYGYHYPPHPPPPHHHSSGQQYTPAQPIPPNPPPPHHYSSGQQYTPVQPYHPPPPPPHHYSSGQQYTPVQPHHPHPPPHHYSSGQPHRSGQHHPPEQQGSGHRQPPPMQDYGSGTPGRRGQGTWRQEHDSSFTEGSRGRSHRQRDGPPASVNVNDASSQHSGLDGSSIGGSQPRGQFNREERFYGEQRFDGSVSGSQNQRGQNSPEESIELPPHQN